MQGSDTFRSPRHVGLMVLLLTAIVAAMLIWYLHQYRIRHERAEAFGLVASHAQALQSNIERALSVTHTLAALVRHGDGVVHDFDGVASQMLPSYPGASLLILAPDGIIRNVVPLAGNEKAVGLNLLEDPVMKTEATIARDTGKLVLAGPLNLVQGGLAVIGRLPVFLNDTRGTPAFWGFTNVVMRFPEALVGARLPQLVENGFDYELWRIRPDDGQKQVIAASSSAALVDPVEYLIELPYGNWTLSAAPSKGWTDILGLSAMIALGLFFSLLLAFLAKLLVESRLQKAGLETLVVQRTADILTSQNQLAAILEAIPDLLFELGLDGTYHACHCSRLELLIAPVAELIGRKVEEKLPAAAADVVMAALREADEKGTSQGKQFELPLPQGRLWFELSVARKFTGPGQEPRFIVLSRDVTERKQSEIALAITNKRLGALVEAFPDAIFFKDGESRWLITNEAAKRLFRLHDIPWQDKTEMELAALHPEFRAAHETCLADDEKAWDAGQLTLFSEIVPGEDGRMHDYEVRKMPIFEEQGRRQGLVIIGRDITERKLAEADLRIAAIAFEAQEGMLITDAETTILRVNQAFTRMTGYTAEEAVGLTPRMLKSGRQSPAFYAAMWESIHRSGSWQGEIWNRRKNGEAFPAWLNITAVKGDDGAISHYVGMQIDITARKKAEDEINNLVFYDSLTQLPNRRLLLDRLKQALASSTRNARYSALLLIDLDNFKTLNDTLGHDVGDQLLQLVAGRLSACVREGDTVARLGGDEFVVMLEDLSENIQESAVQSRIVGEKILAALNQPYQLTGNGAHRSTPSIGVALFTDHRETVDELLIRADLAMYQAKAAGRNTLRFFDAEMQAAVTTRATLEADLREAVLKSQFLLYYQAQVIGAGRLAGVEALLRWPHSQRGMVSPAEFIPLAEETGLILQLGHWVLETACAQLADWAARPEMAHLTIAVNVSARQFHHHDFVDQVQAILEHSGANPQRLKLELTESLLVDDVEDIIAKMGALKAQGVGFSLDDFGTGYSSLSYLKRLPLDQLKIDQGFVRDILADPNDAAIAKMVVALAESMGLSVIAEGVETEGQRNYLADNGCHSYQGYLFSRPLPLAEFEEFVRRL